MYKSYENSFATYLISDGLLFVTYKKDHEIDLKAAQIIVKDRMTLQEGKEMPVLCDIRSVRSINKVARDFLAVEGSLWIKAIAFLIEPPITEAISSFYLQTQTSYVPSQSFTELNEALTFLRSFLHST